MESVNWVKIRGFCNCCKMQTRLQCSNLFFICKHKMHGYVACKKLLSRLFIKAIPSKQCRLKFQHSALFKLENNLLWKFHHAVTHSRLIHTRRREMQISRKQLQQINSFLNIWIDIQISQIDCRFFSQKF